MRFCICAAVCMCLGLMCLGLMYLGRNAAPDPLVRISTTGLFARELKRLRTHQDFGRGLSFKIKNRKDVAWEPAVEVWSEGRLIDVRHNGWTADGAVKKTTKRIPEVTATEYLNWRGNEAVNKAAGKVPEDRVLTASEKYLNSMRSGSYQIHSVSLVDANSDEVSLVVRRLTQDDPDYVVTIGGKYKDTRVVEMRPPGVPDTDAAMFELAIDKEIDITSLEKSVVIWAMGYDTAKVRAMDKVAEAQGKSHGLGQDVATLHKVETALKEMPWIVMLRIEFKDKPK